MKMTNITLCAFADEAGKSLAEQISALRANGIGLLEARGIDGKNISDLAPDESREIKKRLDAEGIKVWSLGSPAGKSDINLDFSAEAESFKRLLETAFIMEAKCVRLFSFYGTHDGGRENEYFSEVMKRLSAFADMADGSGIALCHENEKGIFGDTPERCLMIHENEPRIKAVFDPANYVQCGADTQKAWELLAKYVRYCHIKDAGADKKVVPAGKGIGNVVEILRSYSAQGGGVATLEPHLKVFSGLGALENAGSGPIAGVGGYCFASGREAFDYAAENLKGILSEDFT